MSKNIVPCGGFEFDDSLEIRDGKLSAKPVLDVNGDFIVTFTFDDRKNIISDKTFDEIFEAYKAGKKVSGLIVYGSNEWNILYISAVNGDEITFFLIDGDGRDFEYAVVKVNKNVGNSFYSGPLTAGAS